MVREVNETRGTEGMKDLCSSGLLLRQITVEESGEINYL